MREKLLATEAADLIKYLVIGGTTAALYLGVIFLCIELLQMPYPLAVSLSYAAAVIFHFSANKRIVFRRAGGSMLGQLPRYAAAIGVHYLLVLGIVSLCAGVLGLSVYLGSGIAILLASGLSYLIFKHWVFPV